MTHVRLAVFLLLLVVLSRRGHLLNKERASMASCVLEAPRVR